MIQLDLYASKCCSKHIHQKRDQNRTTWHSSLRLNACACVYVNVPIYNIHTLT